MGASETRDDLIDAAWSLFAEHGFDATSVQAIINRLGLSKGGFYHHFASKDALLEALAERLAQRELGLLSSALSAAEQGSVQRLCLMLSVLRVWQPQLAQWTPGLARALARDDNHRIAQELELARGKLVFPLLSSLLASGMARGLFELDDAAQSAKLLMLFSESAYRLLLGELLAAAPADELLQQSNAYVAAVERLLGAAKGTLPRHLPEHLSLVIEQQS